MNQTHAIALAAVLTAAATTASADQITATNPWNVMSAMQSFGLVATLTTDSAGDPKIESRVSRSQFNVYFYGCDDGKDCTSVQFSAGYNLDDGLSYARANAWNVDKRFTRVALDEESDPFLRMDVNLDYEGVGEDNFEDTLDLWRILIEDFEEFIDW